MSRDWQGLDTDPFHRRLELLDDDHDPDVSGEANLIALPTPMRIRVLRGGVAGRETQPRPCCRFWTTNVDRLKTDGYLGEVWTAVDEPDQRPASLREMRGSRRSDRLAVDCIAKPQWWERRPGGGERE